MTLEEFKTKFTNEIEQKVTFGELLQGGNKMCKMCEYIEYNFFDGEFEFVKQTQIDTDSLKKLVKDIDLVFGCHDVEVEDVNFVERINMKDKIKLLFKYDSNVIEKNVKRISAEYYKLKEMI